MGYSVTKHEPTAVKEVQYKNYLDHVYAVSDDDGDIIEHYRYTAFGEVTIYNELGNQVANTQINNQILWNTRRRDEVTGYYMYKFRHYSAELGRWPSRDPIGERGGVNLYVFVGNNGITKWDILGQVDFWKCAMEEHPKPTTGNLDNMWGWWPANRPIQVSAVGGWREWDDIITNHQDMVDDWFKLGFVIGGVETEKAP